MSWVIGMTSEITEDLLASTARAALVPTAPATTDPGTTRPVKTDPQIDKHPGHATGGQHVHHLFVAQFWYELIGEYPAADFVGLKVRTLQGYRYRGGGPDFVRISARCIKYRRIDLLRWAEARLRTSTSDTRPEDA